MAAFNVITIGDSAFDTIHFIDEDEARLVCNVRKQLCEICFDYADKIPVKEIFESVGGNAANAAVGFSRLGLHAAIYTEIGEDEIGESIMRKLKDEHINLKYVRRQGKTNQSAIITTNGERTIFSYHEKRDYHLPKLESSDYIYLTSLKTGFDKIHEALLEQIRSKKTFLVYNPGTYQLKAGMVASQAILHRATMVIMNREEAASWLKLPITTDIKSLLFGLTKFGTKSAVVTDGHDGGYGFDGINYYFCPIYPQHIIETTGAGDSFATGLSAALFYGASLKEAMRWGTINSASVVSTIGSQTGLLTLYELKKRAKLHESVCASPILT
ncbi:MAG: carbohydrate kinase family protein [bacterium]|nr:carbohydrate kinase family protein [bacterium]